MCVCVCVCVCARARVHVYMRMCMYVCVLIDSFLILVVSIDAQGKSILITPLTHTYTDTH